MVKSETKIKRTCFSLILGICTDKYDDYYINGYIGIGFWILKISFLKRKVKK